MNYKKYYPAMERSRKTLTETETCTSQKVIDGLLVEVWYDSVTRKTRTIEHGINGNYNVTR